MLYMYICLATFKNIHKNREAREKENKENNQKLLINKLPESNI